MTALILTIFAMLCIFAAAFLYCAAQRQILIDERENSVKLLAENRQLMTAVLDRFLIQQKLPPSVVDVGGEYQARVAAVNAEPRGRTMGQTLPPGLGPVDKAQMMSEAAFRQKQNIPVTD